MGSSKGQEILQPISLVNPFENLTGNLGQPSK